ncbi:hypothetical protein [Flammeovirga sp. SJP92]|uniref:hypothetical protein n=1 Tax=Flammeovirga sp. SJP92 TaxID=1775430 RepID=UPI0007868FD1|nr:hypothetical protein [Flammeovirga sp. SJP92]KXX70078.1 hypothetical protein AVL50_14495 [Flammeovirga sp. SJP92]
MNFLIRLFLIFVAFSVTSCAGFYRRINPISIDFTQYDTPDEVTLEYEYKELKGRKYRRKAEKNNIQIVALQITNNSSDEVIIGKNFEFRDQNNQVLKLYTPVETVDKIHQTLPNYLLYLLMTPLRFTDGTDHYGEPKNYYVGAFVGPILTAHNVFIAHQSNKKMKREFDKYNVINHTILPGETKTGLISIQMEKKGDQPNIYLYKKKQQFL